MDECYGCKEQALEICNYYSCPNIFCISHGTLCELCKILFCAKHLRCYEFIDGLIACKQCSGELLEKLKDEYDKFIE